MLTALNNPAAPPAPGRDDRNVKLAWASLVLLPVAFFLPVFLGPTFELEEQARAPFGVFVIVLLVMAALFAVPVLLAWRFANRARGHGDSRGKVPAVIASIVAAAVLAQSVFSWVLWLLQDTI